MNTPHKYQSGQRVIIYHTSFCLVAPNDLILDSYYEGTVISIEHFIFETYSIAYKITKVVHGGTAIPHSWRVGTIGHFYSNNHGITIVSDQLQMSL